MSPPTVEFHPDAIADGRHAREYYRTRSPQAEELFRRDLEHAIGQIREHPETWPRYLHGTQRYILRTCPYSVVYRRSWQGSLVLAIAHAKRRAAYWRPRLP